MVADKVADLVAAYRAADETIAELKALIDQETLVRGGILTELAKELRSYKAVGASLGITGGRVSALLSTHSWRSRDRERPHTTQPPPEPDV